MAVQPAGQVEEETPEAGQTPMPTAPAPVTVTQSVSQAPDSLQQAPAPAQGVSTAPAAPEPVLSRATRPAESATSTSPSGASTTTQVAPAKVETSAPKTSKAPKAAETSAPAAVDLSVQQSQFITAFMDSFKKSAEGKDPVAAAEFNSFIQMNGPSKALAMEGMAMRLRQAGNDGPGAGAALMQMFANDLEFSEDQVLGQISARSAQRLQDMNKWGVDKAFQLVKEEKQTQLDHFNSAVKLGQWDIVATLGNQIYGMPMDIGALKASDPATQTLVANGMETMNTLITQGKAEEAKAVALSLARSNPEAFGFTNPEAAVAAVGQMDFKYEAWANLQDRNLKIQDSARTYALSGDMVGLKSSIDNWADNLLPGALDGMGATILKNDTLEEINAAREAVGKSPITEADRSSLSASEVAKDKEMARTITASKGMNGVDLALRDLLDNVPGLKANAEATAATRRWIAEQQAGFGNNPVPPYDPSSQTAHYYAEWPLVYWTPEGQNTVDPDFEIDDNSGAGQRDLTTEEGKRQEGMDKAYNMYLTNTPKDERLSARDWFYATQAGSRPVPADQGGSTPGDDDIIANTTPGTQGALSNAKVVIQKLAPNLPVTLTADRVIAGIDSIAKIPGDGPDKKLRVGEFMTALKAEGVPQADVNQIVEAFLGVEGLKTLLGGSYNTYTGKA